MDDSSNRHRDIFSSAANYNFKSMSVTAPSKALVMWAAYFASTPQM
jgi:hypothetical protein